MRAKIDLSAFETIKEIVSTIWGTFFGWMPVSLQTVFGAVFAIMAVVLGFKVAALVLDAVPFL